jgi:hypothetical protein
MYILKNDFLDDPGSFSFMREAFSKYRNYLNENREKFHPEIYKFAIDQSIEDISNRNFLHDSWLKKIIIHEDFDETDKSRKVNITLILLGAYHDRDLELNYSDVQAYSINSTELFGGHGDFFRGEMRLSESDGYFIHEFEWSSSERWKIEFSSFSFDIKEKPEAAKDQKKND